MPTLFDALSAIPNACEALPQMITGGQPDDEQLTRFHAAGGQVVLDIRDPMEPRPLDEAALLRDLGVEYVVVPVSPMTMDDATLDRIRETLRAHAGRPMLFHCGSGNRVGAALIPYFVLDQGMEVDDAVQQAMRVGLRSQELLDWALGYTRERMGA